MLRPGLSDARIKQLAAELAAAHEGTRPVDPLVPRVPGLDLTGAYAVQPALVRPWTAAGDLAVAHKIGLRSSYLMPTLLRPRRHHQPRRTLSRWCARSCTSGGSSALSRSQLLTASVWLPQRCTRYWWAAGSTGLPP